jgi:hypothetical protein
VDHLGRVRPILAPSLAITLVTEASGTNARLRPLNGSLSLLQSFPTMGRSRRHCMMWGSIWDARWCP